MEMCVDEVGLTRRINTYMRAKIKGRLMTPLLKLSILIFVATSLLACTNEEGIPDSANDSSFKILVFTKTTGFRHTSIPTALQVINQLAADNNFEVTATEDSSVFDDDGLDEFAAVMFLLTSGDVLSESEQVGFENFIRNGGGFVGVHSATDTEYENTFYTSVVGAQFHSHPLMNQEATLRVEIPVHPSTQHLNSNWLIANEEYYSFDRNLRGEVRALVNIDEDSYIPTPNTRCNPSTPDWPLGFNGYMGDHPISWCHDKYAGQAWYTALGHEPDTFVDPDFQTHLLNGILTVAGRIMTNCTPNARPSIVPAYIEPTLASCQI